MVRLALLRMQIQLFRSLSILHDYNLSLSLDFFLESMCTSLYCAPGLSYCLVKRMHHCFGLEQELIGPLVHGSRESAATATVASRSLFWHFGRLLLEQGLQLALLLQFLDVRVSSHVTIVDKDDRNSAAASNILQVKLDETSILDDVEVVNLNVFDLGVGKRLEQLFSCLAVWAVALRVYDDLVRGILILDELDEFFLELVVVALRVGRSTHDVDC